MSRRLSTEPMVRREWVFFSRSRSAAVTFSLLPIGRLLSRATMAVISLVSEAIGSTRFGCF